MQIKFWGVRGSIASPGPDTVSVGGNTSCVEVVCGDTRLILDAGTGLRGLGDSLTALEEPTEVTFLLSHTHWDHIQGLPFFVPLYMPSSRIAIVGQQSESMALGDVFRQQMQAPVFPVPFGQVPAQVGFRHLAAGGTIHVGEARVTAQKLNHPGGVLAYRIEHRGRSVVYATDTEHYACVDQRLVQLSQGADLLIYDAQYTEAEYAGRVGPSRLGWGHSTWEQGVLVAEAASVDCLALFHHAPTRTDAQVRAIEHQAQSRFRNTVAAREGLTLTFAATETVAA